ncbi:coiled-coil domain-containing protein 13 [Phascolarctos cinereus]|uniref:Coiled-coil domain-containing protein 13 n=1 Tax=Phascolarctos cinereus TaxID=38626 RepID=A0A6P5LA36_PHACI|nr:coiled-coil domain-containing protein 13 [Phascolarctos cinereus]XP_020854790.1 coiled-coil domain-containing protein 13 [Phascolarctos cinereus]XP_020854792.1 coiled-coil domain-containing protein 13 [Phascolarctos cinereus]
MESEEGMHENLRLQFKALQEQQHKRLQRQLEKKREKHMSLEGGGNDPKATFGIQNELNLLREGGQPAKDTFSQRLLEEEIEQLHEQLREIVDENGRLYKLVKEKDFEIKHLKKKIEEDRWAFTGTAGLAGDVIATKIVELSKKNRDLTAETESEKTRVKQLNNQVRDLERELQTALAKIQAQGGRDSVTKQFNSRTIEGILAENPEVKTLQDKLSSANCKIIEYRNQIQTIKQELKLAQKVLTSEVGEDVNIQQLLSSPGTWRGRAQQILVLQSKIRELENQLGSIRNHSINNEEEMPNHSETKKFSAQEKNLLKIRNLEKEKKEALERLTCEKNALQKDHEELKRKCDGIKSRNKVLSNEIKTSKSQIATLLEKGRHDDELIDALMSQLKQLQNILSKLSHQDEKAKEAQQNMGHQLTMEAQKNNCIIAQLRRVVAEREAKVQELEEEIGRLTLQHLQNKDRSEDSNLMDGSSLSSKFIEEPNFNLLKPPASAGDHIGRVGAPRTVSSLGHTLVESSITQPSLPSPNVSPRRPSEMDSTELKRSQGQIMEFKTLLQSAEVERDRLSEFVAVLQKRVDEGNSKLLETDKKLQEERHRCVVLEQQLEKTKMDTGKPTTSQKSAAKTKAGLPANNARHNLNVSERRDLSLSQLSEVPLESQVEELTTRLLIQAEENEALKATMSNILKVKEEDFRLYHETMNQVKQIFLQALRQQQM